MRPPGQTTYPSGADRSQTTGSESGGGAAQRSIQEEATGGVPTRPGSREDHPPAWDTRAVSPGVTHRGLGRAQANVRET